MLDLGELKLKETENFETFYVSTLDTYVAVSKNLRDLKYYSPIGKLKVYHDGFFNGNPEEMDRWLETQVIDHLIESGYLVKYDETATGDVFYKLYDRL